MMSAPMPSMRLAVSSAGRWLADDQDNERNLHRDSHGAIRRAQRAVQQLRRISSPIMAACSLRGIADGTNSAPPVARA